MALASRGSHLVLIGATYKNDVVFWSADDPGEWSVGEPKPVQDRGKHAVDIAPIGDGFIAALYSDKDRPNKGAVLFVSDTGRSWTQIASFRDGEFSSIAAYRQGAIAVGRDVATDSSAVWLSVEGASWDQVPTSGTFEHTRMDVVATDGTRLFAFGRDRENGSGIVWVSIDATTWDRLPNTFGEILFRDAVVTDAGIVAVGVDLNVDSAAIWTSPDGRAWHRVPHDERLFAVR